MIITQNEIYFGSLIYFLQKIDNRYNCKMKSKAARFRLQKSICIILVAIILKTMSTILIVQPQNSGFAQNKIPYSYANFGQIPYGKTHAYKLTILSNDLCSSEGLNHLDPSQNNTYFLTQFNGNCTYTQKARTAQALGASGIIIGTPLVNPQQTGGVIAVDDGNGRKVHIPSLLIASQDCQTLSNLKNISIKVTFQVVKKNISSVMLFLSATGRQNYFFVRDFEQYYKKLGKSISLQLVYYTIECQFCPKQDCVLDNKYCQFDQQQYKPYVGALIIKQQYRQYNLYNKYPEKWFQYMKKFDDLCDQDWVTSQDCSKNIVKSMGIDENFNIADEQQILQKWRRQQVTAGLHSAPEIVVNGQTFSGSLDAKQVYQMICESFVNRETCKQQGKSGGQVSLILLIIILVFLFIVLMILALVLYRRFFRKELTNDMSSRVSELVAKYATKVGQSKKKRKERMLERMNQEI